MAKTTCTQLRGKRQEECGNGNNGRLRKRALKGLRGDNWGEKLFTMKRVEGVSERVSVREIEG